MALKEKTGGAGIRMYTKGYRDAFKRVSKANLAGCNVLTAERCNADSGLRPDLRTRQK